MQETAINIAAGNKFERELDYRAPGAGRPALERNYVLVQPQPLVWPGELWRHSYSRSIIVQTSASAQMATVRRRQRGDLSLRLDSGVWRAMPT